MKLLPDQKYVGYEYVYFFLYRLIKAARLGYVQELIDLLQMSYHRDRINYPDKENWTLMHYAARYNHGEVIQWLIHYQAGNVQPALING